MIETPGQKRTAAARAARRLAGEKKLAQKLTERGWTCHPPTGAAHLSDEAMTVLKNYAWLVRYRDAEIYFDSDMVLWGEGGSTLAVLAEPGLTPATDD